MLIGLGVILENLGMSPTRYVSVIKVVSGFLGMN